MIDVRVDVKQAEAKLEALARDGIPRVLRKSLAQGAKPLRAAVRAETPVLTGALKRGVRYKAIRRAFGIGYVVGPMGKGTAHRHLVTAGHRLPNGGRTRANPFVERGRAVGMPPATAAVEAALQAAVDEEMS